MSTMIDRGKRGFMKLNHHRPFPLLILIVIATAPASFAQQNISIRWEREIGGEDRSVFPYTIQVDREKGLLRIVGVSYLYQKDKEPRHQDPQLFEYRLTLEEMTSEQRLLMAMDPEDITVPWLIGNILDARLKGDKILILRNQYKSPDFQELTIASDWTVRTQNIPGLTRPSVSTLGAHHSNQGDVFLCGNSGFIRKVSPNGTVAWDTRYESNWEDDSTLDVVFSESEQMLVAFGFSFTPDTKFATKDSSLWLANLNSSGEFTSRRPFEGTVTLGMNPTFCLDSSEHPIVAYHTLLPPQTTQLHVAKFSKDLETQQWTTPIYRLHGMISPTLTACENGAVLISFTTLGAQEQALHLSLVDNNGNIIKQFSSEDMFRADYVVTCSDGHVYLALPEIKIKNRQTKTAIHTIRLVCLTL